MASSAARGVSDPIPLGSLTQPGAGAGQACAGCSSPQVTRISLSLADGTPAELTSCHICEHRTWTAYGELLSVSNVLHRARKQS